MSTSLLAEPLKAPPSYAFTAIVRPAGFAGLDTAALREKLGAIVRRMQANKFDEAMFAKLRMWHASISFELNRRGDIAPAYRPRMPSVADKSGKRTAADNLHDNDLRIIDLHWLRERGYDPERCGMTAAPIFECGFSLNEAARFAALNWKPKQKIVALGLDGEEWELAMFRRDHVRELRHDWAPEAEAFARALRKHSTPAIRQQADDWPKLWVARQIAGFITLGREPKDGDSVSPTEIARQYRLMTGRKSDPDTIATRVKRMLRVKSELPRKP